MIFAIEPPLWGEDKVLYDDAEISGASLYWIFVHHMQWRGICLRAIYLQGTN